MDPWLYPLGPNQEHINKTTTGNYSHYREMQEHRLRWYGYVLREPIHSCQLGL